MKLILGDSLQKLKDLPTSTIDACVTDAPYGLKFMAKKWDYDVPSAELWREVFRVLKPGAHVLCFGGTRTYHRMVQNIEDAGFEVRDMLCWLYGSGFPKSLDVSKAIDKTAGAEREIVGPRIFADGSTTRKTQHAFTDKSRPETNNEILPATDAAKQWQGYGTALKPANEPIVLARKPLEKGLTVAQNVMKWGAGALAIDASRIEAADQATLDAAVKRMTGNAAVGWKNSSSDGIKPNSAQGRWPANILFDEEAAAMLDKQSGVSDARGGNPKNKSTAISNVPIAPGGGRQVVRNDSGGASRFFYVAKASKRERNAGMGDGVCNHPTVKPIKLMEYLCRLIAPPGAIILDPFMGSGTTGCAATKLGYQFIGIEREAEYIEIARKRIEHWAAQSERPEDPDQASFEMEPA